MSALEAPREQPDAGPKVPIDLEELRIHRDAPVFAASRRGSLLGRLLVALLLLGVGGAAVWFYLGGTLSPRATLPSVEVARVRVTGRAERARAAGFAAAGWVKLPRYHPVLVTPLVEGRVEELTVIEGDAVEEGQVLARLYAKDYEAQLAASEAAVLAACAECEKMAAGSRKQEVEQSRSEIERLEAELAQAHLILERSRRLQPSGAISLEELQVDETKVETLEATIAKERQGLGLLVEGFRVEDIALAQARRAKAEAERDLAQLKLGYTEIRSPMQGVVLERLAAKGQWVAPREGTIVSLFDPLDLEARVDVVQDDLSKVFVGQTVEITTRAEPNRRYAGEVFLIEPRADLVKNTVGVRVKIAPTESPILHPDMVVKVRFSASEDVEAAPEAEPEQVAEPIVTVPEAAVLRAGDATFVYVIASERAQRADVALGNLANGWYVVESGLRGGEHVAVTGQARLKPGAKVQVAD
jgi:HlyD family secretion protein